MIAAIGQWSHAVAAALYALLAVWQFSRRDRRRAMLALGVGFALTAVWAAGAAIFGPDAVLTRSGETARNLGFLAFLFVLMQHGLGDERRPYVRLVFISMFAVGTIQAVSDLVLGLLLVTPQLSAVVYGSTAILQLSFVIGALLLVHMLYTAATPEARWGIRLAMIGLAAMWAYDLNLYTFAWLGGHAPVELLALRGLLLIGLVPSFALALRRGAQLKMKLSRKVTFRSLSLLAIAGYFGLMYFAGQAVERLASSHAAVFQVALVFLMSAGAVVLLPSQRVRAWLRVKFAKHLFEHRYDYRAEWIRFNETLSNIGGGGEPLDQRVVRAIADITESPGGLLLAPAGDGRLAPAARWRWENFDPPADAGGPEFATWLAVSGHIVEFDPLRPAAQPGGKAIATLAPDWMIEEARAWALVPLIHSARLVGAVLLERPRFGRTLDWEDFDLLRIAGRQAASYLAEAKSQEALAEARRFDEFNRRFAFIIHDIKNLVSQLSLVARNAERHADNPEFRADMVATLRDSVGKMNDLLARLAPKERGRGEPVRPVGLRKIARAVAGQKAGAHRIEIEDGGECRALADPARLETALAHLVQNAIDASPADAAVRLVVGEAGGETRLAIVDEGAGMSADFVRDQLFRPFASSKQGGFGIGAFEARALIADMGGRLEVESAPGKGSRFTIVLPAAAARNDKQRMSA